MIKITFDYDGCLSQPKIQELAKKCISLGCQVHILTSRFDCIRRLKFNDLKPNDDIYQTAEEVGVKPSRIAFTNQEKKWIHLLDTGVHIHIDDDVQVIKDLDYYKKYEDNFGWIKVEYVTKHYKRWYWLRSIIKAYYEETEIT